MCGIAGFFSSQIEFKASDKYRNILYEMKKSLFHRGPDDSGIYLGRHWVLHIQGLRFGMLIMADSR